MFFNLWKNWDKISQKKKNSLHNSSVNTDINATVAQVVAAYAALHQSDQYFERSATDPQSFCRYDLVNVHSGLSGANTTNLLLISRLAIPINPNYVTAGSALWENVMTHNNNPILPAGYSAV